MASVVEEATDKAVKEAKQEETLGVLERTGRAGWKATPYDGYLSVLPWAWTRRTSSSWSRTCSRCIHGRGPLRVLQGAKHGVQLALQNVGEVVAILSELQRMWSYLEPLFIGSDEVKGAPDTAAKFKEIDTTVRNMLREARDTGNVKQACNKDGLIPLLEDITAKQDLCKKSSTSF